MPKEKIKELTDLLEPIYFADLQYYNFLSLNLSEEYP